MVSTRDEAPSDLSGPELTKLRKPPKSLYEGTLVGRTSEHVIISLKGRRINIPREKVLEVRLPKAKTEPMDYEIQKLQ